MSRLTTDDKREGYVAALRFSALNRAFDPLVRLTMREAHFKRELLAQAAIEPGHRVLDIGCGTGTLAIMAKESVPSAEVVGLDGDPDILEQARTKAKRAGVEVRFDHAYSTELPYEHGSFDRVLSTLFFHHLTTEEKVETAREIARVLGPGGQLHVVDFTRPTDPVMAATFLVVRAVDGFERTRVNARGELSDVLEAVGLCAESRGALRTSLGRLGFIRAVAAGATTDGGWI
jgi:ubiquinone/menaquinone biosynthesis C-methylase UbiE